MTPSFWAGRRVLVTGHTGFKGSWLSLWLQRAGAELFGYALPPPTEPSLFAAAAVARGMRSVTGDVTDLEALAAEAAAFRPEVIFHLAAQSLVRASYERPVETYATNVLGTVNVLEAARRTAGVRAVVVVTSDKCYEESARGHFEDDALGGADPYSSSKACAELVAAAYRRSFFSAETHAQHGVAVATARAGNVIGGGDFARDRLVPDAIRAFEAGRPLALRDPRATRPWQHVLEPLAGYLALAERLHERGAELASAYNFGPDPGHVRSVADVADALARSWGGGARWERDVAEHRREAPRLALDSSKARALLGWRPVLPFDRTLEWVVAWHRGAGARRDPRALTEEDIARYEGMLS